jgi:predicted flavoprotein YhiN
MAHPNYKAIKNFIHNELGISKQVVVDLTTEFIEKQVSEGIERYLNSKSFENTLNRRIDSRIVPVIEKEIRSKISWTKLEVTITPKE